MTKSVIQTIVLLCVLLILSACDGPSSKRDRSYKYLSKDDTYNTKYKGHYKVGSTYTIKEKSYTPKQVKHYTNVGIASWYGSECGFHGGKTANGDVFNKNMLTAAHRTLPLPSLVEVTNLKNGRSLIVMVNDRGPFKYDREIDVSEKAASILGFKKEGIAKVRVKYLHKETLQFLNKMQLKQQEGCTAKNKLHNKQCTVNCHIKLVNLKRKKKI